MKKIKFIFGMFIIIFSLGFLFGCTNSTKQNEDNNDNNNVDNNDSKEEINLTILCDDVVDSSGIIDITAIVKGLANTNVIWSVSDTKLVKIENNKLYVISNITKDTIVTITAKLSDDETVSASKTIKIIYNEQFPTISDIKEKSLGTYTTIGVVVAKNAQGFMLEDYTSSILVYFGSSWDNTIVSIGDKIKVTGTTANYGNAMQFSSPKIENIGTEKLEDKKPVDLTNTVEEYLSITNIEPLYVSVRGSLSISGNYYNLTFEGKSIKGSITYPISRSELNEYNGKDVIVTGYVTGVTGSSTKWLNIMYTDIRNADDEKQDDLTCNHTFENDVCTICGSIYDAYLFEKFGNQTIIYKSENPYQINLNTYGDDVYAIFYTPNLSILYDKYINVDKTSFYNNYMEAESYVDSYYRTKHNLMSGDITPQGHMPNSLNLKENNKYIRCTTGIYILDTNGKYLGYMVNNIDGEKRIIYYGGAYTSLNDVAAYLLAFGEVPVNSNYDKNSGRTTTIDAWGIYGRVNVDHFSGNTTYFPYEPNIPFVSIYNYTETDFGTLGGYVTQNSYTGVKYTQANYNTGSKINRGAARFIFISDSTIKSIDDRYVFYTYNHYNDFQEYLNYDNGYGKRFGNESAGNPYIANKNDWDNTQNYITLNSPTDCEETIRLTYKEMRSLR